jgi:hypothetical protein
MIGDQQDMAARIGAVLPARWFPDQSPVLDGLLQGLAAAWSWLYSLLQYVKTQTRIATASDVWLDIISQDFFGSDLLRLSGEGDGAFRRRIQGALFRERGTREALRLLLQDLTGREPAVFEPARTSDTGSYGSIAGAGGGLAYGTVGGWGNLSLPFQCFITAYRPIGGGIASVSGWNGSAGGYGNGAIEYASLDMVQGQIRDSDINAAITSVLPAASVGWTVIRN